jgi:hypothetical protein
MSSLTIIFRIIRNGLERMVNTVKHNKILIFHYHNEESIIQIETTKNERYVKV